MQYCKLDENKITPSPRDANFKQLTESPVNR